MTEHLDVVIVGAGISGVSAAWHLQDRCPTKSYAILEKRESMGGTWDLFRYPGIRSDSDMYTLGFRFRPWTGRQAIADGKPILEYVKSTAAMYGIDRHIRFHHKVISADWSTAENRWTVHIQSHGTLSALTSNSSFCAAATTTTTRATRRDSPARRISSGRSSIRSTGPRTSTTTLRTSS